MMKKTLLSLILLFVVSIISIHAQRQISGQVKESEKGEPLPGVSVVLFGTSSGTITDFDGKYTLNIPEKGSAELIFSFVGYVNQTVTVGNQSVIDIMLISDAQLLDQVVVIGYESVNKRDVIGSVSSVNAKQLKDIPLTNAAEALAGRLAGVQVTSTEGAPGADVIIRVRGGGSITQDNTPIYIVDGIQVENALSVISPQDIASIDVLKDASSTAIYGARGANGVVVITTKSGKKGRTSVSYNGSVGYRQIAKTMEVLDPYEFVTWQYERSKIVGDTGFARIYGRTFDTLGVYKDYAPVNWQEKVFGRRAGYQNHNLSISGGSDKTTYNLSMTRNQEEGIQINSGFTRNLLNFRFNHTANDRFQFGATVRYLNQTIDGIGTTNSGTRQTNRLRHTIIYRPYLTPNEGDNEEFFDEELFLRSSQLVNPVVMTEAEYRKRYSNTLNLNGNFSYKILRGVTFRSVFGFDQAGSRGDVFFSKITGTARNFASLPVARIEDRDDLTFNNSNTITIAPNLGKQHNLSFLLGQELYQFKRIEKGVETRFFPADITPQKALANMGLGSPPTGSTQPFPTTLESPYSRISSFFGRVSYDFKSQILASFSLRADRSTKFKYENGLLYFPSGSVAWRFTQLTQLKDNKILTDGKIRLGFGTAGNNRIGDLLYLQLYGVSGAYALNHNVVPGFASTALANEALRWESTQTQNVGLDLGFFQNRVQLTIDAYQNKGKDLLLAVAIPPVSGYSSQLRNVGSTSNRGLEIQLNGDIIKKKDLVWNSSFNISFNRNKVESLGGLAQQTRNSGWQGSDGADDYLVKVGEPVGLMYGFITDGWYKPEDFDFNTTTNVFTLKTGIPSSANFSGVTRPGSIKIKDLNGDGFITTDGDRTIIGNATPDYIGGWNNQVSFKGIDASVFVNFVVGNDVYNANNIEWTEGSFPNTNLIAKMRDRYRYVDDKGNLAVTPEQLNALNTNAKIWFPSAAQRYFVKDADIEDGSFFRINNVTLGYTLPMALTSKLKMQSFRIYGTINNLKVFSNYSGYDPEVTARNTDPLTPGVDFAAYPRARIYVLGVNATF
jgi:TonB-dependent starch-binding outer membrane protein SusC